MKALTVNQLWKMCIEARKQGLGSKRILITTDDEWNGFHELWDGFTTMDDVNITDHFCPNFESYQEYNDNYIILG